MAECRRRNNPGCRHSRVMRDMLDTNHAEILHNRDTVCLAEKMVFLY